MPITSATLAPDPAPPGTLLLIAPQSAPTAGTSLVSTLGWNNLINILNGLTSEKIVATSIAGGGVTDATFNFLANVTSDIQTQLNGKQPTLGFTAENTANKDIASGYAGLDASALLKLSEFPTSVVLNTQNNNFGLFYEDIQAITAPTTPPTATRRIFVNSANNNKLSVKTESGAIVSLEEQAGSSHILLDGSIVSDSINTAAVRGSIVVSNSTPKWTTLNIGANGTVLTSNGLDPSWTNIVDANVSSIAAIAKSKISTNLTWLQSDLPTSVVFNNQNNNLGAFYEDLQETSTPPTPVAGTRRIFVNASTHKLSVYTSSGTAVSLEEQAGSTHALLDGAIITDSVAASVSRGALVVGNSTPLWGKLSIGAANKVLHSDGTDATWQSLVKADLPNDVVFNDQNNALGAFYQDASEIAAPANPASGTRRIYVDSASHKLSVRTSAGTTLSLEEGNSTTGITGHHWVWYQNPAATYVLYSGRTGAIIITTTNIDTFMSTFNAGLTAGDSTYIGEGTWPLHNTAIIAQRHCSFTGCGWGTFISPDATFQALDVGAFQPVSHDGYLDADASAGSNNGNNSWHYNVYDMYIHFPITATNVTANKGIGVDYTGCGYGRIEHVIFQNCRIGVNILGQVKNPNQGAMAVVNKVKDCYFKNNKTGVKIDGVPAGAVVGGVAGGNSGGQGNYIDMCTFLTSGVPNNADADPRGTGIEIADARNWIRQCHLQNMTDGILLNPSAWSNGVGGFVLNTPDGCPIIDLATESSSTLSMNAIHASTAGADAAGVSPGSFGILISGHFEIAPQFDNTTGSPATLSPLNKVTPFAFDAGYGNTQITIRTDDEYPLKMIGGSFIVTMPNGGGTTETQEMVLWEQTLDAWQATPVAARIDGNVTCEKSGNVTLKLYEVNQTLTNSVPSYLIPATETQVASTGSVAVVAGVQKQIQTYSGTDDFGNPIPSLGWNFTYATIPTLFNKSSSPRTLRVKMSHSAGGAVKIGHLRGVLQRVSGR